ncbi:MAG: hypothetical protein IJS32_03275, partial [Kiritimatiellae bacterium]|nr:hypothetical protein [Kiritimatiellia bacterium]
WGPVARMPRGEGDAAGSGQWTREGCGVIGPVPPAGGAAEIRLRAGWFAPEEGWESQTLFVRAPWGEEAAVEVGEGTHDLSVVIPRGDGATARRTGAYAFRTARPWDPAAHGIKNFPADLGVLLSSAEIAAVP